MIRHAIAATLLALPGLAPAETQPVVVELFTSQGCAACPPADRMLAELAAREDVIALSLHVDYWDYIGWADEFADPAFTVRQKAYAHAAGERMIYTPQVVVNGTAPVVGSRPGEIVRAIGAHAGDDRGVSLRLAREGGRLKVKAWAEEPLDGPLAVHLVRFDPHKRSAIGAGENAGLVMDYANVVTDWRRAGTWDGAAPLELTLDTPGDGATAVLLQREGPGAIVAAARAD